MIAVIFEAYPREGKWTEYVDIAAAIKPELGKVPGFISVERFQGITDPEKVLSLSFWENEESIAQWRNMELHRMAQQTGRNAVFEQYRIRVAAVVRDYGKTQREQAPEDSKLANHQ